ncbi:hypothetical protein [Chryseobacterium camelliae]|uniref:hypothetical protein n=1 Tax=Chryseobacterium camelliae TaxID=1265445 RepID=UPI002856D631|nr:hypothetical protein [Chryseobacterium camelliae]MDR6516294.1 hypothetical protein [Chryseobacterium camelliae]
MSIPKDRSSPAAIGFFEKCLSSYKAKRMMLNLDKAWDYTPKIKELADLTGTSQQIIMKGSKNAPDLKKEVIR